MLGAQRPQSTSTTIRVQHSLQFHSEASGLKANDGVQVLQSILIVALDHSLTNIPEPSAVSLQISSRGSPKETPYFSNFPHVCREPVLVK
jgi:hypothetical protein